MSLAAGARSWTIEIAEGAGQRRTHKRGALTKGALSL